MMKWIFVALIFGITVSFLHLDSVLADGNSCIPHEVCIHPGNYLKYHLNQGQVNSSETYTFGNMTSPDSIQVMEQYFVGNNKTESSMLVLDLKTGYGHSVQGNTTIPFLVVLPVPIQYNQSDISVSKEFRNFNGFNRTTVVAVATGSNGPLLMEYDTQTGVLLSARSIGFEKTSGKSAISEFSNELVDTNIINSNSIQNIVIPSWIKNTAGWWGGKVIGDSDFVKAIQYLISKGIMQIPHGSSGNSSSQAIPAWIKNNAKWWSEGKISDNDFISGIQYLINSGIVKV